MDIGVQRAVQQRLSDLMVVAQRHWKRSFPMPLVSYDLRGRCAGQALLGQNRIRINRTLLLENLEAFLFQTVGHEVAHRLKKKSLQIFQQEGPIDPDTVLPE